MWAMSCVKPRSPLEPRDFAMSARLRHLYHPGPALQPRAEIVAGSGTSLSLTLEPGRTLLDAVARALGERGIESAALSFDDALLDPLVYYVPAIVEAPYLRFGYSDARRPEGGGRLERAYVTFGRRDGAPFLHCHAAWRERDGQPHGGHVVPDETVLAEAVRARAAVLPGAALLSEYDPETDYQLFHPVPVGAGPSRTGEGRRAYARVRPNEDLTEAVEGICRREGFRHATVRGLGSLIGARFADGSTLDDQGSEVLIMRGEVSPDAGGRPRATLDICFTGFDGLAIRGRLLPGENPVCITFELLVEEGPDAAAR